MDYSGAIFLIIAALWVLIGFIVVLQNRKMNNFGEEILALVLETNFDSAAKNKCYDVLVEYTVSGVKYRKELFANRIKGELDVGDYLPIGYDTNDPQRSYVHNNTGAKPLFFSAAVFFAIGLFTIIAQNF